MNAQGKDATVLLYTAIAIAHRWGQVAIGSGGLPPLDFQRISPTMLAPS
jgi:hypothetical protein